MRTSEPKATLDVKQPAKTVTSEHPMNIVEDQVVIPTAGSAPKTRRRRLRAALLAILTAQYTIIAIVVSASVAGTLRYLVTPQIVAQFEAISAALKH